MRRAYCCSPIWFVQAWFCGKADLPEGGITVLPGSIQLAMGRGGRVGPADPARRRRHGITAYKGTGPGGRRPGPETATVGYGRGPDRPVADPPYGPALFVDAARASWHTWVPSTLVQQVDINPGSTATSCGRGRWRAGQCARYLVCRMAKLTPLVDLGTTPSTALQLWLLWNRNRV